MAPQKPPDRQPAGWTEQVRVVKGRKVKAMKSNTSPEWLPPGWIEESKTYQNGSKVGRKYKCYIDPQSGYKFYSRPAVLGYLETVKLKSSTSQQKKTVTGLLNNPDMGELTGGKTSVKLERSQMKMLDGTSYGSQLVEMGLSNHSVGKEPDTGGKTSVKVVTSPMETQEGMTSASEPMPSRFRKHSVEKQVVIESAAPDGLPLGWIKEIRIEKKANGIRKDPYFTDPVSRYVFRSQKDVLRYLKTGDIKDCAIKPKKRDELDFFNKETKETSLLSAAKMQLGDHTTSRHHFVGAENTVTSYVETTVAQGRRKRQCMSVSADVIPTTLAAENMEGKHSLDNAIIESAEAKETNHPGSSPSPRTDDSKQKQSKRICARNRTLSASQEEKVANIQICCSKSERKKDLDLPIRSSKRLVGLKPIAVNLALSERGLRAAARKSGYTETKTSIGNLEIVAQVPMLFETVSEAEISHPTFGGAAVPSVCSSKSKRTKDLNLPIRSSKRLLGLKPMAVNLALSERGLRAAARESDYAETKPLMGNLEIVAYSFPTPFGTVSKAEIAHPTFAGAEVQSIELSNESTKPLEDQVILENQPVRQEIEKKDDEIPESQLSDPFGDPSSSDRCLGFSFKSLKRATSIEDNLAFEHTENIVATRSETVDVEGLQERHCTSVTTDGMITSPPSIEMVVEINNPSNSSRSRLEGSWMKQDNRVCAENRIVFTPIEMVEEEELTDHDMGKNEDNKLQVISRKSKKKKVLPCRSSKRLSGLKPEVVLNLALSEHGVGAAAIKSSESEVKPSLEASDNMVHSTTELFESVTGESGENEVKPPLGASDNVVHTTQEVFQNAVETGVARHGCKSSEPPCSVELTNGSIKPLVDQAVPEGQPWRLETEKRDHDNPELQLCPFGETWSDSLEFAFKTLTGEIPIEDNIALQEYFQHQFDTSHTQMEDCSAVPEFSLPNFFHCDISSAIDATGKPASAPLLPVDLTFPTTVNVSLPSSSGNAAPQQPCLEENKEEHQTKLNS